MKATAIDLFAGAGGFTTGARDAGVNVVWAANHFRPAVDAHLANHPSTHHVCQDLHQADWRDVPRHDIILASPSCKGHSKGRGVDRPHHDAERATAWAVVSAAEYHRPPVCIIENVPEFTDWALFPAWRIAMEALGYSLAIMVRDAADHGVPQNRERVIIVATRSRAPISIKLPEKEHVPASAVLRFNEGQWSRIAKRGRAPRTLRRVKRGRAEFGSRFIMPYYGSGSGLKGRSVHRPIGTITTVDRWALVDGNRMRMLSIPEARAAMGFPDDYALPRVKHLAMYLLGNAIPPPMARDVISAVLAAA